MTPALAEFQRVAVEAIDRSRGRSLELWEELRFDAEEYCEMDDDSVLVVCRMRGRGRGSGVEVDQRRASLFHIRAGKVIRLGLYWERDRALAEPGLKE